MDTDITFSGATMTTLIYVKFDAAEQLLLSEGVCHQLGIISYRPDVQPVNQSGQQGGKGKHSRRTPGAETPSEERRKSETTSLTSDGQQSPLLPTPSEERRKSGTTSLTSDGQQSPLLPTPSEERRKSGTTSLTSDGQQSPLLPTPSEERMKSGTTSLTSSFRKSLDLSITSQRLEHHLPGQWSSKLHSLH